ncbi:MAG TPA: SRPBCC family protein [Candidatus Dormibacteraeota bacterium]|nr:SRPBCC family protein [Candidatus Dormibacteraeota bacterium]
MDNNKPEKHTITASAIIPARRERVYSLIANYNDGHPRILPKQFSGLVVEQGGVGAGTVIRFQMSVFGRKQTFRAAITEPDPGRVLVETDLDANGAVTTFTVSPGTAPADSSVTISTELPVRGGFLGKIERTLSTLLLRPMYVKELENLARVSTGPFGA